LAPAHAPNFNGSAEAAVKSVRRQLLRAYYLHKFTSFEFAAVLTKIQGWLNDRPLCLDGDSLEAIVMTLKVLLQCSIVVEFPEPSLAWQVPSVRNRVAEMQEAQRKFWNSWSTSYLESSRKLSKWLSEVENIEWVGKIVLLVEELIPRARWNLARITSVIPSHDKLARAVELKLANGSMVSHPISKLILLPLAADCFDQT
jgi:Family of unknown function (DUF5641)